MILTITNTTPVATDMGYLLHKNPARVHRVEMPFGVATVFYPEAEEERCTAALLVDVDPVGLVRKRDASTAFHYVNDRPYAASSFLSVALGRAFGTAMNGRCKDKPELVEQPLALTVTIPALPVPGDGALLHEVFEPLGYSVTANRATLDEQFPEWGESKYAHVTLSGEVTVRSLLQHLYVLIPVLDNDKHYWIGDDEVQKLLAKGGEWLPAHPAKELISRRYLAHRRSLVRQALEQLTPEEAAEEEVAEAKKDPAEEALEKPLSLNEQRYRRVMAVLAESNSRSVVDLGCGEGKLLARLFKEEQFDKVGGMDVSPRALDIAARRINLNRVSDRQRERLHLFQGSLLYRDKRLSGYDAACLVEVIEHMDPPRLAAFERTVFANARPQLLIVTTPNIEYNVRFETLIEGKLRHGDHRFEWTRHEFRDWADRVASSHGYAYEWRPIGDEAAEVGPPTQMMLFTRAEAGSS